MIATSTFGWTKEKDNMEDTAVSEPSEADNPFSELIEELTTAKAEEDQEERADEMLDVARKIEVLLEDYSEVPEIKKSLQNLSGHLASLLDTLAEAQDDHTEEFEKIALEMYKILTYTGFVEKPDQEEEKAEDAEAQRRMNLGNSTLLEVLENPAYDLIREVHLALRTAIARE